VAAPVPDFITFEVFNVIDIFSRLRFVPAVWRRASIPTLNVESVIHVAVEARRAMKPRAGPNEYASGEPLRAIVAIGCTGIGSVIVIAVRAVGCDTDIDCDLSVRPGGRCS
jgi:hypothetical protein